MKPVLLFLVLLAVSSCSVVSSWNPYLYIVKHGDNLYQIAWQYNLTVAELKQLNNIGTSNTIYVGDRLKVLKIATDGNKAPPVKTTKTRTKQIQLAPNYTQLAFIAPHPHTTLKNIVHPFTGTRPENHTGIFINLKTGSQIRAVADGKVVYKGNAIKAYGLLVIVKHRLNYLSAYAFLLEANVTENQNIKKGQLIGKSGRNLKNKEGLHFEIRLKGIPINPIKIFKLT